MTEEEVSDNETGEAGGIGGMGGRQRGGQA